MIYGPKWNFIKYKRTFLKELWLKIFMQAGPSPTVSSRQPPSFHFPLSSATHHKTFCTEGIFVQIPKLPCLAIYIRHTEVSPSTYAHFSELQFVNTLHWNLCAFHKFGCDVVFSFSLSTSSPYRFWTCPSSLSLPHFCDW